MIMLIMQTSSKPYKVTPDPTPGYIYLYSDGGMYCKKLDKELADSQKISSTSVGVSEASPSTMKITST